jgi:hypothetical protein
MASQTVAENAVLTAKVALSKHERKVENGA